MNKKIIAVLVSLLAFGVARQSWQRAIARELKNERLLAEPLSFSTKEKIGQTSAAVTLGGLRTVIATFLNLRAYGYFENQDWVKLEDEYHTIVTLQPHSEYYWDAGSWHLAYNAAADAEKNESLPPLRASEWKRKYVQKGRAFLVKGLEKMPESWFLWEKYGRMLSDGKKFPDYQRSADAFYQTLKLVPNDERIRRAWIFSLARVPGKELETLAEARKEYQYELTTRTHRTIPMLCCLLFVLESQQPNALPTMSLIETIFPSKKAALTQLQLYWQNKRESFPMDGVERAIELLEAEQK